VLVVGRKRAYEQKADPKPREAIQRLEFSPPGQVSIAFVWRNIFQPVFIS